MRFQFTTAQAMVLLVLLLACPVAAAEQCRCPGDMNDDTQVDLDDLQLVAQMLLDAGSPFVVPCNTGDCADINSDGQIDLEDLQAIADILLDEGSPFIAPCIQMVWVSINDPGVPGHEGFNGQMSKYETTNAQYCEYLNSAMNDGLIMVYNNDVYAVSDTSHSQIYLELYPQLSSYSQITYSGETFSVRRRDGYDMSNHPVVEVTWYGAAAFCNYYGYRLPTEWEWQAVADYDGSYTYGCGTTIDHSKANYDKANPLGLSSYPFTSPVDHYSSYGYGMNDMAGNVWEWTSGCYHSDCRYRSRVVRGGSWYGYGNHCTVSYRNYTPRHYAYYDIGFRACR